MPAVTFSSRSCGLSCGKVGSGQASAAATDLPVHLKEQQNLPRHFLNTLRHPRPSSFSFAHEFAQRRETPNSPRSSRLSTTPYRTCFLECVMYLLGSQWPSVGDLLVGPSCQIARKLFSSPSRTPLPRFCVTRDRLSTSEVLAFLSWAMQ